MLTPGSLPTCSADTASTMLLALRLSAVEFSMLLMKPFTSTASSFFVLCLLAVSLLFLSVDDGWA